MRKVRIQVVFAVVLMQLALVAAGGPSAAAATTIDAPGRLHPALGPGQSVLDFRISPDSSRVVFLVQTGAHVELQMVPIGGGSPVTLNSPLAAGRDVLDYAISPDSSRVVYVSDEITDEKRDLFSVPIAGGPVTRLTTGTPVGIGVSSLLIAPDSSRVVFSSYLVRQFGRDLFSVPLAGGATPTRLHGNPLAGTDVESFSIAPDSSRVVFVADLLVDNEARAHTTPLAGGTTSTVHTLPLPPNGDVQTAQFAGPGLIVYSGDLEVTDRLELYSATPTGGSFRELNGALTPGGSVFQHVVSPDGTRAFYTADQITNDVIELFTVPSDAGSPPVRINTPLPAGRSVASFQLSPDGTRVAYVADQITNDVDEMFSVPALGGTVVRLNPTPAVGGDVNSFVYHVTPDSSRLVFHGDLVVNDVLDVFSVPLAGGTAVRLDVGPGNEFAERDGIMPDSSELIVYDETSANLFPIAGGPSRRVSGSMVAGGAVDDSSFSPDGRHIVYLADQVVDQRFELFVVHVFPEASAFTPLPPSRIFDSRPDQPAPGPKGFVAAGTSVDVQVTGAGGVPGNATAVVLNVTATESAAAGFVTVWPAGQPRPLASSLNLTAAGQTRPNLVVVPVGAGGRVSLFSQAGAHLLADVTGYFTSSPLPVSAGRILPLPPARVFDTRESEPAPGPKGFVPAGGTISVQVAGVGGVPADATAAVLNVTATSAGAAGFVTVWPSGQAQPLASTLNLTRPGDTTPNLVIMPLGAGGRIDLFTQSGAHLLADVTGYVTSSAAPVDASGLFVPLSPARVFDTRPAEAAPGPKGIVSGGATIAPQVAGAAGLPSQVGLAVLNLTATDADTGFVTAFPGGTQPLASTLNLNGPADTRPNAAIVPLAGNGTLSIFVQSSAHLLADTSGYTLP